MRTLVLDTETTGLSVRDGDRIVEIACIELKNESGLRGTAPPFHCYLNPDRDMSAEAAAINGLSDNFLAEQPRFNEVVEDFIQFVQGAEIIIHNAEFDCGFLDMELKRCDKPAFRSIVSNVIDTLKQAKEKFPGKRANLNALARHLNVQKSRHRSGSDENTHSALGDAELLGEVYIAMHSGQQNMALTKELPTQHIDISHSLANNAHIVIRATPAEENAHQEYLTNLAKTASKVIWQP